MRYFLVDSKPKLVCVILGPSVIRGYVGLAFYTGAELVGSVFYAVRIGIDFIDISFFTKRRRSFFPGERIVEVILQVSIG